MLLLLLFVDVVEVDTDKIVEVAGFSIIRMVAGVGGLDDNGVVYCVDSGVVTIVEVIVKSVVS